MSFVLEAKTREIGKASLLNELRKNSRVPAIVYGFANDSQAISVDYNAVLKILKEAGTSHVVTLQIDGQEKQVIVKSFDQDPVTDKITHVDLMLMVADRPVTTVVPLAFVGVSKAVKELGAKLETKNQQVTVKCLPADLPASLEIDLNTLTTLGQTILVKDIPVSEKVSILNNPNDPVISVKMPKRARVEAAAVVAAPVEEKKPEAKSDKK
ncbi:50S ribosomal protein L25 [Patescibacteria group bacterium]|jgi:large subunit ribosomal protein L25|nr:50S ribosomal protein L25 [Patescibacteria group bacterium]